MSRDIDIREVSTPPESPPSVPEFGAAGDVLEGLEPWLVGLVREAPIGAGIEACRRACESVENPEESTGPHRTAARVAIEYGGPESTAGFSESQAVVAALYLLKRRGFEVGRPPEDDWRINRVLNAGSRVLDTMLEHPALRRLSIAALFYRILNMGLQRAEVGPSGLFAEVSCGVEWNEETGSPLRRELPETADVDVVDWLLDELMTRGLEEMTLGSVVQESREGRRWEIDDAFGDWMSRLAADEARFVAGNLFSPARLGGWEASDEDRLLDVFGVARNIDEDFAPDEEKTRDYRRHLRQIEGLRGLPDRLSPTLEISDDDASREGRFEVSVHPVRRGRSGDRGFFVLEAGFAFDEKRPEIEEWPRARLSSLKRRLCRRVQSRDESTFGAFSNGLNEIIDVFHEAPSVLVSDNAGTESAAARRSPMWEGLDEGIEALREGMREADVEALTERLRRWTFRCSAPS